MSKMTRGAFRLGRGHVEVTGQLSPFLRFCIGISIVPFAITPLVFIEQRGRTTGSGSLPDRSECGGPAEMRAFSFQMMRLSASGRKRPALTGQKRALTNT